MGSDEPLNCWAEGAVALFCEEGEVMKLLTGLVFVALAFALSGCGAVPGYSASERYAQIQRNNVYQSEQAGDDLDHILLLRPSNQESIWNVYHRD